MPDYGNNDFLSNPILTSDGGILFVYDSDTILPRILKIKNGVQQWARQSTQGIRDISNWWTTRGYLILVGQGGAGPQVSQLVWLDSLGNTVRSREFPTQVYHLEVLTDNRIAVASNTTVVVLDSNGVVYNARNYNVVHKLIAHPDGGYVVRSGNYANKTRSNYELDWRTHLYNNGPGPYTNELADICITGNGDVAGVGYVASYSPINSWNCDSYIVKLDGNTGQTIWSYRGNYGNLVPFLNTPTTTFNNCAGRSDGSVLVLGSIASNPVYPSYRRGFLFYMNGAGTSASMSLNFAPPTPMTEGPPYSLAVNAHDGGNFVIRGISTPQGITFNRNMDLYKLKPPPGFGCLSLGGINFTPGITFFPGSSGFNPATPFTFTNSTYSFSPAPLLSGITFNCNGCVNPTSGFDFIQDSSTSFHFLEQAVGEASYSWNFGDGSTSTIPSPYHDYAGFNQDSAYVCLTVTNACGSSSYCQWVDICPPGMSSFQVPPMLCTGDTITFANTHLASSNWQWTLNGAPVSNSSTYTMVAGNPPNAVVSLVSSNSVCADSTTQQVQIVNSVPTPAFSITQAGNTWSFTNTTVNALTYTWDFGDGTSSTQVNPSHTYSNGGPFTICLTAVNPCGWDSVCITRLCESPHANFNVEVNGTMVEFLNLSAGTSAFYSFGDGNTSTAMSPVHTYSVPGMDNPLVTQIATNACATDTFRSEVLISSTVNIAFFTAEVRPDSGIAHRFCPELAGGYFFAGGNSLGKFDRFGNQNWSQKYELAGADLSWAGQANSGDIFLAGKGTADTIVVMKVSPTGSPMWVRKIPSSGTIHQLIIDGNSALIAGVWHDNSNGFDRPWLMKYDLAGNQAWSKRVMLNSSPTTVLLCKGPGPNYYMGVDAFSNYYLFKISPAGAILTSKAVNSYFSLPADSVFRPVAMSPKGTGALAFNSKQTMGMKTIVMDTQFVFLNSRIIQTANPILNLTEPKFITELPGGGFIATGNRTIGGVPAPELGIFNSNHQLQGSWLPDLLFDTLATQFLSADDATNVFTRHQHQFSLTKMNQDLSSLCLAGAGDPAIVSSCVQPVTHNHTWSNGPAALPQPVPNSQPDRVATFFDCFSGCNSTPATFTWAETGPLAIQVTAQAGALSYLWDFGDGVTANGLTQSHVFSQPGTYNVCLTTQDSCGSLVNCLQVQVCVPLANLISPPNPSLCPGDTLVLTAGAHSAYLWSTGSTDSSAIVTAAGPVSVEVTDVLGCQQSDTVVVTTPPGVTAFYNFTFSGLTATYQDLSAGNVLSWFWDFGDGSTSTQQNPVHTFSHDGPWSVCLTVTSACFSDNYCDLNSLTAALAGQPGGQVRLYPNPANDRVTLESVAAFPGGFEVSLSELSGRIVKEWHWPEGETTFQFGIEDLTSGMWLLQLQNGEVELVFRLVKQ